MDGHNFSNLTSCASCGVGIEAYEHHKPLCTGYVKETDASTIKHFDRTHFTATTIGGRVFLYCPVGNICSWAQGDVEHRWCEWCNKGFEEIASVRK